MPKANVNGTTLYYEQAGSGAPVVYVHGGFPSLDIALRDPSSLEWTWEHEFASHFHFVAYDRRGSYRSSRPSEGYDLPNQARDLDSLLCALQIESAHVIGSSAGGPIATLLACTKPDRVRSLVLAGTAVDLFPQGDHTAGVLRKHFRLLLEEGEQAAYERRPEGVEVTLRVLWEPDEQRERGTLKRTGDARRWAMNAYGRYA